MKLILFVDDEPKILDGLKRMLRSQRKEWYMLFVESGELALEKLASEPFDVIVSDMRMPGMDGATLLSKVQELYPDTIRIVLSGHTELEAALRAIPIAHHFLTKPSTAETIKEVIERACKLQELLNYESVRHAIGTVKTLPVLPRAYAAILQTLADPTASLPDVAKCIEQDISITTKILQVVNSGFFRFQHKISNLHHAISCLGLNIVKNLVLSVEVFQSFEGNSKVSGSWLRRQQHHALHVANVASQLIHDDKHESNNAFMAGLLHDVGKLILASELSEYFSHVRETAIEELKPIHVVENESTQVTHAEIGAYLLRLWGLPYTITEAVANHHMPARVEQQSFGVLGAVYVANLLVHDLSQPGNAHPQETFEEIDIDYLDSLGVCDELPKWKSMAAAQIREESKVM